MKFHDLAIGQRFELAGTAYVKTSPVLASRADGAENKFMARSAAISPLDGAERRPAEKADRLLRAEAVLAAFDTYHAHCHAALEQEVPADRREELADVLESGRQDFIETIGKL